MKHNRVLVSYDTVENISEQHIAVFYRKSNAKRTLRSRLQTLKNFRVYTAEQVLMFEDIFSVLHSAFLHMLQTQYPLLTPIDRVLLAFLRIGLNEKKICRNTGWSEEELKRNLFVISKKIKIPVIQLPQFVQEI